MNGKKAKKIRRLAKALAKNKDENAQVKTEGRIDYVVERVKDKDNPAISENKAMIKGFTRTLDGNGTAKINRTLKKVYR